MNDRTLADDVETELAWDPVVQPENIAVMVRNGAVTLSGYVSTFSEKRAAVRAAERVNGVRTVADEIEVQLADAEQDPDIAEAILASFRRHTDVPESVRAEVRNGWVTLLGEVESNHQRFEAERAVANTRGVTGVTSRIAVSPSADAADLERRVTDALRRNAELDADMISVTTKGGTVTLDGHVHSAPERRAAEDAAWAPGVSHVRNQIVVRP
jgi:osmotically-inducible protein OsmY